MPSLATLLQLSGPAILGIGALAATAALCAIVLWRPGRSAPETPTRARRDPEAVLQEARLRARALLNHKESDWLAVLDAVADIAEDNYRVIHNVPLDRVLEREEQLDADIQGILRELRIDFLIIDDESRPVMGAALVGPNSDGPRGRVARVARAARVALAAREALERAGIPVIEILPDDSDEDIAAHVYALLLSADDTAISA